MRSKNAAINFFSYVFYEVVFFACNIIFPRFIILTYGSDVNGLTSTIYKLLAIVSLIQAGAIGAASYQMFKPVAENDYDTQSAIIYSSRKFYNVVTAIYFCSSCVLGVIYGFYLENEYLSFFEIFLSFLTLGLSGCFPLFFNSICDIYVSSHQKAYYLKISAFANLIVHYGILTVVLLLKLHFVFIYVAILLGSFVNGILNYVIYKKLSKGKITNNPTNKKFVIPDRKYLMLSTIGTEAISAAPTIIITTLVDLSAASVFSIYSMIFGSMKTILNSIQYSIAPIFGNAVNTADDKKLVNIYDCIELATMLLGTVASACCVFLIVPFVKIYTSGITDATYLNTYLAIFVTSYIVILAFRASFNFVAGVHGLFKDLCNITILLGIIGVVISFLCLLFLDFSFVMLGLIVNEIGCSILILALLKRKVAWYRIKPLLRRTIVLVVTTLLSAILYSVINPQITSFSIWFLYAIGVALSTVAVLLVYCLLFEKSQIKKYIEYGRLILKKKSSNTPR